MSSRRLALKLTTLAVVGCSALAGPAAGTASAATCAGAGANPVETSRDEIARSTVCLLNEERADRGLRELRLNPRLSEGARAHSLDMIDEQYFGHVSKSGRDVVDRLTRTGYLGRAQNWAVGENLAWGSGGRSIPRRIVNGWMGSPGHRHNILSARFREIGIGMAVGTPANRAPKGATYTTTFGTRG
jgi:uncharacterized protein YkwD